MRLALYARVSTKDKGQNPETQLIPLRDLARARNYEIVGEYVDTITGSKDRRPQLDRLMADAQRKKFDALMVWRFDRFGRSTTHLLTALGQFQKLGIDFISHMEAVDTTTPIGKMVFTILAAVAEMERELIRERVLAGQDRARREGRRFGRPRVLVDKDKLCRLMAEKASISEMARQLGVERATVRQLKQSAEKSALAESLDREGGKNP